MSVRWYDGRQVRCSRVIDNSVLLKLYIQWTGVTYSRFIKVLIYCQCRFFSEWCWTFTCCVIFRCSVIVTMARIQHLTSHQTLVVRCISNYDAYTIAQTRWNKSWSLLTTAAQRCTTTTAMTLNWWPTIMTRNWWPVVSSSPKTNRRRSGVSYRSTLKPISHSRASNRRVLDGFTTTDRKLQIYGLDHREGTVFFDCNQNVNLRHPSAKQPQPSADKKIWRISEDHRFNRVSVKWYFRCVCRSSRNWQLF